ncbi:MAG: hypothetical protein ABWY12_01870 [Burkholderiales bacterium]
MSLQTRRRSRTAGTETTVNNGGLPGEFLGALLFCVVLPMVWLTGIAVAYVEHLR